jgi:hypothetical protein
MRFLVLVACVASFSGCVAGFGVAGVVASAVAGGNSRQAREGAAREAAERALHAREAAEIRRRYRENQQTPSAPTVTVVAAPRSEPSAPPLIEAEPARTPLRPRR